MNRRREKVLWDWFLQKLFKTISYHDYQNQNWRRAHTSSTAGYARGENSKLLGCTKYAPCLAKSRAIGSVMPITPPLPAAYLLRVVFCLQNSRMWAQILSRPRFRRRKNTRVLKVPHIWLISWQRQDRLCVCTCYCIVFKETLAQAAPSGLQSQRCLQHW